MIGTNKAGGGYDSYGNYGPNGTTWQPIAGGAVRIDVDPKGRAWIVNSGNDIYRLDVGKWNRIPGKARGMGIGIGMGMGIGTLGAVASELYRARWRFMRQHSLEIIDGQIHLIDPLQFHDGG